MQFRMSTLAILLAFIACVVAINATISRCYWDLDGLPKLGIVLEKNGRPHKAMLVSVRIRSDGTYERAQSYLSPSMLLKLFGYSVFGYLAIRRFLDFYASRMKTQGQRVIEFLFSFLALIAGLRVMYGIHHYRLDVAKFAMITIGLSIAALLATQHAR